MIEPLRRAGWWLADYLYAARGQLRAVRPTPSAASLATGEGTPVVLLPGIYETWRFLLPLARRLHRAGHPVHVVPALRRNRRPIVESAARVSEYLDSRALHGVVLVAHSKGGLIGKVVMNADATDRVGGMVAIATPFAGSRYARLMPTRSLRTLSPLSPALLALARETSLHARIVSVAARFDPHVPEGSYLAGARNVVLDTGGHFRILADPRVLAEITRLTGD